MLSQAIRDIYNSDEKVRQEVLCWILTRDFITVCDYAFVDPDSMREQLANLATMKRGMAYRYGYQLRMEILHEEA